MPNLYNFKQRHPELVSGFHQIVILCLYNIANENDLF